MVDKMANSQGSTDALKIYDGRLSEIPNIESNVVRVFLSSTFTGKYTVINCLMKNFINFGC